jgi:hypothetical protein
MILLGSSDVGLCRLVRSQGRETGGVGRILEKRCRCGTDRVEGREGHDWQERRYQKLLAVVIVDSEEGHAWTVGGVSEALTGWQSHPY